MPLYHTMGIHSLISMHLIGGCFVSQARWDAEEALRLIQEQRITSLYLAPTLFYDLVHHPRVGEYDLSSVEALCYAGAAMTSALVERCVEVFRPRLFVNYYGSTEIYTFSIHRDQAAKPGCAGRAVAGRAAAPRRERRDPLPHGRGRGLHRLLEPAGRRREGDSRRLVPHGRRRPARRGRRSLGPRPRRRHDHLGRRERPSARGRGRAREPPEAWRRWRSSAAPDDRLGQRVVAVVVADGELTAEELDAFCLASDALARFKRPREYRFVESLPKSPSGKILRRLLREEAPAA